MNTSYAHFHCHCTCKLPDVCKYNGYCKILTCHIQVKDVRGRERRVGKGTARERAVRHRSISITYFSMSTPGQAQFVHKSKPAWVDKPSVTGLRCRQTWGTSYEYMNLCAPVGRGRRHSKIHIPKFRRYDIIQQHSATRRQLCTHHTYIHTYNE